MEDRITRLRAHSRNIDPYQSLLKTRLSDAEQRYLEGRLSEERFAITTLNFTSSEIKTYDPSETPNQTETSQ
jgi:hypothetical protein